jgi:thioredoxin 1
MGSCFSSNESSSSVIPITHENSSLSLNHKIHEITTEDEFNRLLNDIQNMNVLIVGDFYAIWCVPCLQIAPVLSKWALNDYKTNVIFMKINVDKNDDLANRFSINVLPTFVLFKQGKEISRLTGADSTNLRREIEKLK